MGRPKRKSTDTPTTGIDTTEPQKKPNVGEGEEGAEAFEIDVQNLEEGDVKEQAVPKGIFSIVRCVFGTHHVDSCAVSNCGSAVYASDPLRRSCVETVRNSSDILTKITYFYFVTHAAGGKKGAGGSSGQTEKDVGLGFIGAALDLLKDIDPVNLRS
jgi:hypothetical protein